MKMRTLQIALAGFVLLASLASAETNLVLNGTFGSGGVPSVLPWTGAVNAVTDTTYGTCGHRTGWNWDQFKQDTGSVFLANATYNFSVMIQNVDGDVDRINFWVGEYKPDGTMGTNKNVGGYMAKGVWGELTLTLNTAETAYVGLVGKKIGIFERMERWVWPGHPNVEIEAKFANVRLYIDVAANTPTPANGAANVGTPNGDYADVTLGWKPGPDPNNPSNPLPALRKYYLYISEDRNLHTTDPNLYYEAEVDAENPINPDPSYGPVALNMDGKYNWRVDEAIDVNGHTSGRSDPNTIVGAVWTFDTIKSVPVIIDQPDDLVRDIGQTAEFAVSITTISPETYQWYKSADNANNTPGNDTAVGTGLDTLTINNAQVSNEGYYFCKITNGGGQALSNVARLGIKQFLAHWTLDQAKFVANQYVDEKGNYNADPNNPAAVSFVAGPYSLGTTSAVAINDDTFGAASGTLDPTLYTDQLTVSAWIRLTSDLPNTDGHGIVSKRDDGDATQWRWSFYARGRGADTGANSVRLQSWNGIDAGTDAGSIPLNEWVHVVATLGSSGACYVNGLQNGYTSASTTFGPNGAAPVMIGRWTPTLSNFPGEIDDVKIYNYGMDKYGVAQLYNDVSGQNVCIDPYASQFNIVNTGTSFCKIDLEDFAEFAGAWLDCGLFPTCP